MFKITRKPKYEFVSRTSSNLDSVRLLRGPYKGVVYTYGKVSITGNEPNYILNFTFVVENGIIGKTKAELSESVKFKTYIGDLLTEILSDDQRQIGNGNNENNTQEADSGRRILPSNDAPSEG